jgi:hypothetical protein
MTNKLEGVVDTRDAFLGERFWFTNPSDGPFLQTPCGNLPSFAASRLSVARRAFFTGKDAGASGARPCRSAALRFRPLILSWIRTLASWSMRSHSFFLLGRVPDPVAGEVVFREEHVVVELVR